MIGGEAQMTKTIIIMNNISSIRAFDASSHVIRYPNKRIYA